MATIGPQLRKAREAKGVTISEAAHKTKILPQILEDLEKDDFKRMAAPMYTRGFIKIYSEYLGLDPEAMLAEWAGEEPAETRETPEQPSAGRRWRLPPWIRNLPANIRFGRFAKKKLTPRLRLTLIIASAAAVLVLLLLLILSSCGASRGIPAETALPAERGSNLIAPPPEVYLEGPDTVRTDIRTREGGEAPE
ncbi:helix-turn-helix domain-containing protein [Kiritimatiella glycovorans]|uniref:Cytoskeletal protein RodZ n=1 Tax=Kiritimatiella glycovorans TaxID=1307763 RepID=A0A0G3EML6_9BACT|nr:helix-turn-helix domain-containing protein [Kiritimatiella glycovorans]AKJ65349.1 hypothetical protein L21SP4_02118 [Kiritimatiella glycovorans]